MGGERIPWSKVQDLLAGLSYVTGLRIAICPPEGAEEAWGVGEEGACEIIRSTRFGAVLCRDSHQRILARAASEDRPVFDLCHARLGQLAVPVREDGVPVGTITVCGALVHGLSDEHAQYLGEIASRLGLRDPHGLQRAAAEGPCFSRSRLAALGDLIHEQVGE